LPRPSSRSWLKAEKAANESEGVTPGSLAS
jgi:hypothetical protein